MTKEIKYQTECHDPDSNKTLSEKHTDEGLNRKFNHLAEKKDNESKKFT